MAALLDSADQALPVTQLTRKFKEYLDKLKGQESDKYVVMRNNMPEAVLMSVDLFQSMMDEIEDLRIEATARERLATFDGKTTISHQDMWADFDEE